MVRPIKAKEKAHFNLCSLWSWVMSQLATKWVGPENFPVILHQPLVGVQMILIMFDSFLPPSATQLR